MCMGSKLNTLRHNRSNMDDSQQQQQEVQQPEHQQEQQQQQQQQVKRQEQQQQDNQQAAEKMPPEKQPVRSSPEREKPYNDKRHSPLEAVKEALLQLRVMKEYANLEAKAKIKHIADCFWKAEDQREEIANVFAKEKGAVCHAP